MKMIKWFAVSALMMLFAACGGGGGSSGTSSFGSGSGSGTGSGGTTTAVAGSLVVSISTTTATLAAPATVTATLTSASGAPLAGQVVNFSTSGALGAFSSNSALTDSSGQAVVKLTPASSSSNGADLVIAKATVGSAAVTGSIGFQVTPSTGSTGQPTVTVALSTSSVTTATPATLTATVRDSAGAPSAGQVVKFSTSGGNLGALSSTSALTDANGVVTVKITPASSGANGADLVIAQSTVGGVLATGSIGFSVTSTATPAPGTPSISLTLSTTTVTSATPATVTALVRDATGVGVVGQVVKFTTVDGLGTLTIGSALTDTTGSASTTLTATSATQSGADQVVANTTVNGTALQASQGFRLTAASVAIASFTSDVATLGAYGQTGLQLVLSGTIPGTPVSVSVTSACIASGKATITPATASTTNGTASFTYRDQGCGATSTTDALNASIAGSAATASRVLSVGAPTATSINFISAAPTSIFLKGSGLTETSTITFRVLDQAGNGLPLKCVLLHPTTLAGGLVLDDGSGDVTKKSDNLGNVVVRVNSGTVPTPVRITATLLQDAATSTSACPATTTSITTVSSSLSIGVGLPSQLNFSLSQTTLNIEGYNVDGVVNNYNIIASDRLGNPVPAGTAINFVAEGGQIQASQLTTIDASGNARASANFLSSEPRPLDGRITILAYALGEESFLDQNGDNVYTLGEPFQDLGRLYLDRLYNGVYNSATDQFISLSIPGVAENQICHVDAGYAQLLGLNVTIPSIPATCDGNWGKAYVRRATETVLSTSAASPVWFSPPSGSGPALYRQNPGTACSARNLITSYNGDESANTRSFVSVGGNTVMYRATGAYTFLAADANPVRLNPMAAGSSISVSATDGVSVKFLGGSPVPSTTDATGASFSVSFTAPVTAGTVTLTFTSPRGLSTSFNLPVDANAPPVGAVACP